MSKRKPLVHFTSNNGESVPKRFKQTKLHFGISTIFLKDSPFVHKSPILGTSTAESSIQTQLDLGQQKHRTCICNSCGMAYNLSNSEDYQLHHYFHVNTQYARCLHFNDCLSGYSLILHSGNTLFHVNFHSPPSQIMKAKLLWEYLQSDHGFVHQNFDADRLQLFGFLDRNVNKVNYFLS